MFWWNCARKFPHSLLESPYLFQSQKFLTYQGNYFLETFGSVAIAWFEKNGQANSPLKAPFGSVYPIQEVVNQNDIGILITQMENRLRLLNLESITITHCPEVYQPEFAQAVNRTLLNSGFCHICEDLNFHLPIEGEFKLRLHRSERWKLNKAKREEYRFQKINPPNWDLAFPIIEESRIRKGYPLSMNRKSLEEVFGEFSDTYKMYGVFQKGTCAAVAITIEVSKEIEYIFYTADVLEHRKRSPVVLLHEGIFEECKQKNKEILDLGTASLKGKLNEGVASFKKNLGGLTSSKNTYFKELI